MLGHPTGAEAVTIAMMTAFFFVTNQELLTGEHPGALRGPDTIVGKRGVPEIFCLLRSKKLVSFLVPL